MRFVLASVLLAGCCVSQAAEYQPYGSLDSAAASSLASEQRRLVNERNSLLQQRQFEAEQSRMYSERRQRDLQTRAYIERTRGETSAYVRSGDRYPLPVGVLTEQDRFMRFLNFVRPALKRDDFEAVKFAAQQMKILDESDAFDREYYDKLRALLVAIE